jgi:hypothetical protein
VLHRNAVKGGFLALEWTDVQQYKLPKLKRHEDTIVHKAAEMWVKQGKASLHDLVVESAAPTLANFKDLWDQLMRGGGVDCTIDGIGGGKKLRRMMWCLAETIREQHRAFLRTAETVVLPPDGDTLVRQHYYLLF